MESAHLSPKKLNHLHILISLIAINGDISNKERQLIYSLGLFHGLSFTEIDMLVYHPLNLLQTKTLCHLEKQQLLVELMSIIPPKEDKKANLDKESLCLLLAERLGIGPNGALEKLPSQHFPLEKIQSKN